MSRLPPEIWYHVTSYLPEKILYSLFSVNSVFFKASMYIRHGKHTINIYRFKSQETTIQRLQKYRENGFHRYCKSLKIVAQTKLQGYNDVYNRSCGELGVAIVDLIRAMLYLKELEIFARNTKVPDDLQAFFTSLWQPSTDFPRLKAFRFDGDPQSYSFFPPAKCGFPGLTELLLSISHDAWYSEPGEHVPSNSIVDFVNEHASQLHTFELEGFDKPERWVTICDQFIHFPLLDNLTFNLSSWVDHSPYDKRIEETLSRFLSRYSASLLSLNMRVVARRRSLDSFILSRCLSDDKAFRRLRELHLELCETERTDVPRVILARCLGTLESFYYEHLCPTGGITEIIGLLKDCPRLSTLSLYIRELQDIRILDAVSSISALRSLSIYWPPHTPIPKSSLPLANYLKNAPYFRWKLKDIGLYVGSEQVSLDIMHMLVRFDIPSVRSFWGLGYMEAVS